MLKVYLRIWLSSKPYLAFSHTQNVLTEPLASRIGLPFMSASEPMSSRGWVINACGSFWNAASTARTGAPACTRLSGKKLFEIRPGRSLAMCASAWVPMSSAASQSVDSSASRSSAMMARSQAINASAGQSASASLRYRICATWMRPSSIGVAQLTMTWRTPDGYSMSSRRLNGRYHWFRIERVVVACTRSAAARAGWWSASAAGDHRAVLFGQLHLGAAADHLRKTLVWNYQRQAVEFAVASVFHDMLDAGAQHERIARPDGNSAPSATARPWPASTKNDSSAARWVFGGVCPPGAKISATRVNETPSANGSNRQAK